MTDPSTRLVSMTITEKGYTADLTTLELDDQNPANNWMLKHSLGKRQALEAVTKGIAPNMTALAFLTGALEIRRKNKMDAFTIMSCDNLQGNGNLTKKLMLDYSSLYSENLATWIEDNVSFPNSMVDRITPMTTQADVDELKNDWGIHDEWPVVAEDFTQWVVDDAFKQGRPEWEAAGAMIVKDVIPYEKMKLSLLNGSH
jgi:mannitol 2-dehydrogenase